MRQNFVAQFVQFFKHWLYDLQSGVSVGKNWAHSVDQCQLQALQFSVHLIDLLSIVLRYNGFTRIQKAVVDRQATDHKHWPRPFWCKFGFEKWFGGFFVQPLVVTGCHITSTFCHTSLSDWEIVHCCYAEQVKMILQNDFLNLLLAHPFIKLFHLSNLLQMLNDQRMVNVEFFSNFLCGCNFSFNDPLTWLLSTSDGHPLHSSFRKGTHLPCKMSWTPC